MNGLGVLPGWPSGMDRIAVGATDTASYSWPLALGIGGILGYTVYALGGHVIGRMVGGTAAEQHTASAMAAGAVGLGVAALLRFGVKRAT